MAKLIVKEGASPSAAAARSERRARIEGVLDKMDARDREILALRYFEGLSCAEAALVLGIQTGAAAKRYERALQRLKAMASGLEGSDPGGA
jgi:RNA polymerase sigma-70 factor (ECF subfamily)